MDNVIKLREAERADSWVRADNLVHARERFARGEFVLISVDVWREWIEAVIDEGTAECERLGVEAPAELDLKELAAIARRVALIALRVAKFKDGRVFSTAKLLRDRVQFRRELRVVGEVHPDQLLYMARCGVDSWELPARHRIEVARKTLQAFSVAYQDGPGYAAVLRTRRPAALEHGPG